MSLFIKRIKNWLGYENLLNTDVNAEFNNIISKTGADTLSSANSTNGSAATVAAMQTTNNPGGIGTENLALTNQQDIQQLRFMINEILGGAQWYSTPSSNLSTLANNISSLAFTPASRIVSGRISAAASSTDQSMFLVPDGTAATVRLKAASTHFTAFFNGASQTFSADLTLTSLQLAPSTSNTALVNDTTLSGQQVTKIQGERGTQITIDTIGSGISNLNGTWAAFKHSTEYFLAYVDTTNNRLIKAFRGVAFDTNDAWLARTAVSDDDTITLCKLTWLFATYNSSTPALALTYNAPTVALATPTSPAVGDYWYDITNSTWKVYNGSSFTVTSAVFAGFCIQDTTGCKAARSADFFELFNPLNTIELEYFSTTTVQANAPSTRVSVYGKQFSFDETILQWNTALNMDTGLTVANNTNYGVYVTDSGGLVISDVYPTNRKYDLYGGYHPAKPWRCVGEFTTDGSAHVNNDGSLNVANHWEYTAPSLPVTYQTFAAGSSGNYYTPIGAKKIRVRMFGGGGGGGGSSTGNDGGGSNGSNTTFGGILAANAGTGCSSISGGVPAAQGGIYGTASITLPAFGFSITGARGSAAYFNNSGNIVSGGAGGSSFAGGAGAPAIDAAGGAGSTWGGGGAGGGAGTAYEPGGGGGGAGYVDALINNPLSSYAYSVGSGGAGGTGTGSNKRAGGVGGDGVILVEEYYT